MRSQTRFLMSKATVRILPQMTIFVYSYCLCLLNSYYSYGIIGISKEVVLMRISTKGRYALQIMVDLAQHYGDNYISLKDVAERQGVSLKYLEAIAATLNKAGFIMSSRGKTGGYRLSRPASGYTVGSILKLAEGSLAPVSCLYEGSEPCSRSDICFTLPMWQELDRIVDNYLESVTIEDLVEGNCKKSDNQ